MYALNHLRKLPYHTCTVLKTNARFRFIVDMQVSWRADLQSTFPTLIKTTRWPGHVYCIERNLKLAEDNRMSDDDFCLSDASERGREQNTSVNTRCGCLKALVVSPKQPMYGGTLHLEKYDRYFLHMPITY